MTENRGEKITLRNLSTGIKEVANTVDDLGVMCIREFTAIREIMERTNTRMETMGARLDNISEIVIEDHKPRIRALEMQVFLD